MSSTISSTPSSQLLKRLALLSRWPVLLILLLAAQIRAVAVDATDPYKLMQQLATRTFERLDREQPIIAQDANHVRTIVHQELMPYVHIRYAGALSLGNAFKALDSLQQQRYFQAFGDYIEQSYAQILVLYQPQRYTIEPAKPLGERSLISIRVTFLQPGGSPLRIDFKWRKNSKIHQWQLYDIATEGVSLMATKQQEWSNVLRQTGIDSLIEQLQLNARRPITLDKAKQSHVR